MNINFDLEIKKLNTSETGKEAILGTIREILITILSESASKDPVRSYVLAEKIKHREEDELNESDFDYIVSAVEKVQENTSVMLIAPILIELKKAKKK